MEKAYTIMWIDQLTRVGEMGAIEHYNRVRFKTKGGLIRTMDIEEKDLTEEKVKAVLTKEAEKLDKILSS